jgi:hypothetical protein
MAAGERGQTVAVTCQLEHHRAFSGQARAKLVGLPAGTSAEPVDVVADDEAATFQVAVADNARIGRHRGLFVELVVMRDGQPIMHRIAQGGVLRVDAPRVASKPAGEKPAAAKPEPRKTAKPLTRLEQLRLERRQQRMHSQDE